MSNEDSGERYRVFNQLEWRRLYVKFSNLKKGEQNLTGNPEIDADVMKMFVIMCCHLASQLPNTPEMNTKIKHWIDSGDLEGTDLLYLTEMVLEWWDLGFVEIYSRDSDTATIDITDAGQEVLGIRPIIIDDNKS